MSVSNFWHATLGFMQVVKILDSGMYQLLCLFIRLFGIIFMLLIFYYAIKIHCILIPSDQLT